MEDDGGVLGNLPRSRPGRRSEKRAGGDAAKAPAKPKPAAGGDASKAPAGAKRPAASAEKAARAAERSDRPSARQAPRSEPRRKEAAPSAGGSDPVGDVIRTATKVAGTGVRVAAGVAQEVLRRIPRP
ncbi:MAG TPA: hypothetical protein VGF25_06305 [Thermoleophilaceae bacterium]|jgi:hypothetical protein